MSNHPGFHAILVSTGVRASQTRTPDRVAVTDDHRSFTYTQMVDRFNRTGSLAKGLGLKHGDHVAVMSTNCVEYLEIVCGMADVGVASAMVSPQATPREVAYICNDAEARILFVHKSLEEVARAAKLDTVKRIIVIGGDYEDVLQQARPEEPDWTVGQQDVFSIPYTSGTTGEPKGVMLSHQSRVMHMLITHGMNAGCYQPSVRGLAIAPFFNGAGFINGLAPIWFGGTVHMLQKFEAEETLKLISDRKITVGFFVPTHFHAMFNLGAQTLAKYDVSSMRMVGSGAAALPQETKERIVAHFGEGRLFEGYGSTEAGGISNLRPEDQLRKKSCVGLPLTGVELKILDDDGNPVAEGEIGEVVCRNGWLFNGYWNKPEQTAEVLRDGWYYSGDLGRRDEEGYLYIVDRKKNVIITGGQNVSAIEVEGVLQQHPAVRAAAVAAVPDAVRGDEVMACIVPAAPATDAGALARELVSWCLTRLAYYKAPGWVAFVEALPLTATNKVQRGEMKALAAKLLPGAVDTRAMKRRG